MEDHTQIQNVSDFGFTAETALNQEEDPRILASSYMMYKIGKFSSYFRGTRKFLIFKIWRSGQLFCSWGLKLTEMQIQIIGILIFVQTYL